MATVVDVDMSSFTATNVRHIALVASCRCAINWMNEDRVSWMSVADLLGVLIAGRGNGSMFLSMSPFDIMTAHTENEITFVFFIYMNLSI
eukprot:CAMPEP_0197026284 /NCGR_PEP_ID=MMETSP1384-20130603/6408_1 /TAXON_ID=29189 /ORGANISM="Ammonia sp." /LENGTH=89 /DNA_ID=CAMNT_0042454927 /DNA_START=617 /DNA_END=886 /DNA_ORIENTATION=-